MDEMTFIERVHKYFNFLVTEYEYEVTLEINSQVRSQTDGVVEYRSVTTAIVIDSETGYAANRVYRLKDGKRYYLDPITIHEYLNTTESEKKLLLSANPKDQLTAAALFDRKFLFNQPNWKTSKGDVIDDLEKRLKNYASWLKEHAKLCLKGDFSLWPEIYEYKILRARADYLRSGKNELGYARVKDTKGNWKLIKQSVFKDKLEHIEKLKKEFHE